MPASGNQRWGGSSWFGGPNDKTTGTTTASGAPTSQPGIAVYNQSTLGGWWMLKAPNGSIGLVQQTDIGPAPSTGRQFDYTYSLLSLFGYNQQNFPTGGQSYGVYVGKADSIQKLISTPASSAAIAKSLDTLGATTAQKGAFIGQLDAGSAGLRNSTFAISPSGKAASQASTAIGSEAVPSNIIPSPSVPDVAGVLTSIWSAITSPSLWKRVLYFVGGAVLLFWGIKELTGAHIPEGAKTAAMAAAV